MDSLRFAPLNCQLFFQLDTMDMKCIDDGCYDLRHGKAKRQRKIQTYRFRFKRLDADNLGLW
jgi:hypothetical protein